MFAVVRTGGKQYRVAPGDKIVVEKLDGNAGDRVTLGDVLLAGDGGDLKSTDGLTVAAEIVAQAKSDKVTVFKKRRRHNYRRKKGHRQQHTILRIVAVGDHKAEKKAAPKAATAAPAKTKDKPADALRSDEGAGAGFGKPTASPAPQDEAQANPPAESVDAPAKAAPSKAAPSKAAPSKAAKAASGKKTTGDAKTPKASSTKNAVPAKGAAKKTPKAK